MAIPAVNIVSFRVKLRVEISSSRTLSDSSGSLSREGVSGNGGMRDYLLVDKKPALLQAVS